MEHRDGEEEEEEEAGQLSARRDVTTVCDGCDHGRGDEGAAAQMVPQSPSVLRAGSQAAVAAARQGTASSCNK